MGWKVSEIAELAGVTVRAVRYWHQVGLLQEPERLRNGYRSYEASHLVRILQISRLTSLGFSLAQVREFDLPGAETDVAFHDFDDEIVERINQLQQIRGQLRDVRVHEIRQGLPPGFIGPADNVALTEQEKSTLSVLAHLLPEDRRSNLAEWVHQSGTTSADEDFHQLSADAGEVERDGLAHRMLPAAQRARDISDGGEIPSSPVPSQAQRAAGEALRSIYNEAQLDVLVRVARLLESESK